MPDLSHVDLVLPQFVLSLIGVVLCIWVMQLSGTRRIAGHERGCLRAMRRIGIALLACGLLWSLRYGYIQEWQPWPPFIVVLVGVDLTLLATVISGHLKAAHSVS
jgi:predicted acyltransferase